MPYLLAIVFGALRKILLKTLTEKLFIWMFFWAAGMIVEHTKTKLDDEFLKKVKEIYDEQSG